MLIEYIIWGITTGVGGFWLGLWIGYSEGRKGELREDNGRA